jgi:hypothetical protein
MTGILGCLAPSTMFQWRDDTVDLLVYSLGVGAAPGDSKVATEIILRNDRHADAFAPQAGGRIEARQRAVTESG